MNKEAINLPRLLSASRFNIIRRIVSLFLLCFIFFKLFYIITYAITTFSNFDAAFHLQAANSWITKGYPALEYPSIAPFHRSIQIGWPFLVPVGIASVILPEFLGANLVSVIFFLGLIWLIYCLTKGATDQTIPLISIALFLSIPKLHYYATTGFGEIPAFFYFLFAAYLLARKPSLPVLSGVFLGLAFETKTILFLGIIAFVVWSFIVKSSGRGTEPVIRISRILIGLFIPILATEAHRLIILGSASYVNYWNVQFSAIASKGASSNLSYTLSSKFANKLMILNESGVPTPLLSVGIAIITLAFILYLLSHFKLRVTTIPKELLLIIILVLGYAFWWIVFPYQAFFRRFINPLAGIAFLTPVCLYLVIPFIRKNRIVYITALLLFSLIPLYSLPDLKSQLLSLKTHKMRSEVAEFIINEVPPESTIGVWGWWQAPRISWLTKRIFIDLSSLPESERDSISYIVVTKQQRQLAPDSLKKMIHWKDDIAATSWNGDTLYYASYSQSIFGKNNSDIDKESSALRTSIEWPAQTQTINRQLVGGVYSQASYAWVSNKGTILLKNDPEKDTLRIHISAPKHVLKNNQIDIKVYVNGDFTSFEKLESGDNILTISKTEQTLLETDLLVEILPSRSFVPSEIGLNDDKRTLSVILYSIWQQNE
ncbi:hypothetical protein VDG1235_1567 [Verrucomicrobiia bacterium DG1235]|nr:hypothetical protein VDG1235_1567 [Verrucomicrobiae bacterium DG1235]